MHNAPHAQAPKTPRSKHPFQAPTQALLIAPKVAHIYQNFHFPFSLPPNSLLLASSLLIGTPGSAAPATAWRMMASRCFAFSLPLSAARTYHTLASSGSRRQPMPISMK